MRKMIVITVFIAVFGMVGWSIYDYYSSNTYGTSQNDIDGGLIVADPDRQDGNSLGSSEMGLGKGKAAPDFELETLDGEKAKLSDYRGKKVIVNFWATWCPPCRKEIPDLIKLYNKKDVEILAVNMTADETSSMEEIKQFAYDEFEMPFPILMDVNDDVRQTYKVAAYPTSYMVDTKGNIQFMAMGAMTYDQMANALNELE